MDSNPSESEMMADLAAADSAGDTQLAQHIAGRIQAARAAGPKPSVGESIFEGAGQGASLGWKDEMVAGYKALAKRALPRSLGGTDLPMGQQYREDLGVQRAQDRAAQEANPKTYIASNFAGSLVPQAVGTFMTGGAGALPMALAQGGLAGAGYSNADSAGRLARDAGVGVGLGALGYGAGQAVSKAFSGLGRFAGSGARQAESRAAGKAADEVAGNIAREGSSLGGESQKGQRMVENLRRLAPDLTTEEQAAMARLEQKLAASTREALPGQVGRIEAKEASLKAMQSGASDAFQARKADLLSTEEAKRQVMARLLRYGPPAVGGMALSGLGHAVGGPMGAMAGGPVGLAAGAVLRPMFRSMIRLGKNPAVQKAAYDAVENAAPTAGTFLKRALQAAAVGPAQQAALAP